MHHGPVRVLAPASDRQAVTNQVKQEQQPHVIVYAEATRYMTSLTRGTRVRCALASISDMVSLMKGSTRLPLDTPGMVGRAVCHQ